MLHEYGPRSVSPAAVAINVKLDKIMLLRFRQFLIYAFINFGYFKLFNYYDYYLRSQFCIFSNWFLVFEGLVNF